MLKQRTQLLPGLVCLAAVLVFGTPAARAGGTIDAPTDLGNLSTTISTSGSGESYYVFSVGSTLPVGVILNGLSAGYRIELMDTSGNVFQSSDNPGTWWTDSLHPGSTGGSLSQLLGAGSYLVHVVGIPLTGNPLYASQDGSFVVNLIALQAPQTLLVAASDSVPLVAPDYNCTGTNDQNVINQAIAEVGAQGGGTVILLPGTYNISDNVLITYDNVTMTGLGWGTILRLTPNASLYNAGLLRSAFQKSSQNVTRARFVNQHFLHLALDGNRANGTSSKNSYGNFGTYADSSFEDLRVHDFPHYGFDPHENTNANAATLRILIKDSLTDHNSVDGMTTDMCVNSTFTTNVIDANDRHGINVVTGSQGNTYSNNLVTNNGANGIMVQPGSDVTTTSDYHTLINNVVRANAGSGISVYRAIGTQVLNNKVSLDGQYGIRVRSSTQSEINGNTIQDDSQSKPAGYNAVYLDDDDLVYSMYNRVEQNVIAASSTALYHFGIAEKQTSDNYNSVVNNTIQGIKVSIRLKGPNSVSSGNIILP